jgi:hypothetical protein
MGDSKSQKRKVIGGQSVMNAQAVQGWQQLLLVLVLALLPFSSPQHTHSEREGVGGRREERGRDKPKGGLWILSPSSICRRNPDD